MKKTIIGSVFMFSGILITLSLIITAALYVPKITEWRGSRLWFAIFGASDLGSTTESLTLGVPFVIGLLLFGMGLLILLKEYFDVNCK